MFKKPDDAFSFCESDGAGQREWGCEKESDEEMLRRLKSIVT